MPALLIMAHIAQAPAAAGCAKIASLPQQNIGSTVRFAGKNLQIDVDLSNDDVTIRHGPALSASCKTSFSAVTSIYQAGTNVVVFQAMEIAADDWFFVDPANCREIRSPLHLGVMKQEMKKSKLRKAGYCVAG